jgi:hypothetical protein
MQKSLTRAFYPLQLKNSYDILELVSYRGERHENDRYKNPQNSG